MGVGSEAEMIALHDDKDIEDIDANLADEYTSAITPQTEDPATPTFTFRSVLLGSLWGIFLACANALFSFRSIPFSIPGGKYCLA
jgi:hypothetical protein